jgi:DNA polymerase III subunit epsilon
LKTQNKFWWFVTVAISATMAVLCTIAILFWQQLGIDQKHLLVDILKTHFAYFFVGLVLLFSAFGFTLDWFFRFYIIPINQLAEKILLVSTVNPAMRIQLDGAYDVMRLVEVINQIADRHSEFRQTVEQQLANANAQTEAERNILAAILEDLPQGILICNLEGQIVFHNRKSRVLLGEGNDRQGGWLGLDRSVYAFVDPSLLRRALERIGRKLTRKDPAVGERFLLATDSARMQPVDIRPVLDSRHRISGFILFLEDCLPLIRNAEEISNQLQAWRHQLIQSISVIKSTAEIMRDESNNLPAGEKELIHFLAKEAERAAGFVAGGDIASKWCARQPLPLTILDISEWTRLLVQRVTETAGVEFELADPGIDARVSIDIHHLTHAVAYVFIQLKAMGITHMRGVLTRRDGWLYLNIYWNGNHVEGTTLNRWKQEIPRFEALTLSNSLYQILELHGAKLWPGRRNAVHDDSGLMFLLPLVEGSEIVITREHVTVLPDSRPEFYDFNLFRQTGHTPELDQRSLRELTYTVFDTETTGLDPQGGDEIISMGAVRIVNGRLLREERFNQLIDPQRALPGASIKYHGIRPEMLENQPRIENILPLFYRFAQDTILIGHNVAFDLRMLQMKETATGIRFENPVLDTMLLSALVHPAHPDHGLDAVAERLGIVIEGRHTALGDAVATAEIFLRLLPILAENGIITLAQARQASEKTYLARLKY